MMARLVHIGTILVLGLIANMGLSTNWHGLNAQAQMLDVPISGPVDPRVRSVLFREDAVVALRGHYGYQMMVEFGTDERIENVSIGDSLAWQVTPNRRADTLFLKPIEFNAATNMSVVTSKRRYTFQLSAEEPMGAGDPNIIYRVKFTFPPEPVVLTSEATPSLTVIAGNTAYSVSGSPRNVPARIYDDGANTYLEWANGTATPAIFAVSSDGTEAVVNFIMRGNVMVVERVGPAFILRNGSDETRVTNDAWREATPGPDAPTMRPGDRPATTARRGWFGLRKPKAGQ
jgi:type IV secretion system protein VirB9